MCVSMYASICVSEYIYIYIYVCVCEYMYEYICMYTIHPHTHNNPNLVCLHGSGSQRASGASFHLMIHHINASIILGDKVPVSIHHTTLPARIQNTGPNSF